MEDSTLWWLVAGLLVAAELVTGTFYLLMLALGAAAGAVGAHLGLALAPQIALAGVVGGGASALWHLFRRKRQGHATGTDTLLDVGQTVQVAAWQPDGSTQVHYRGAQWSARLAAHAIVPLPQPGTHRITGVQGTQLLLEKL
ncbi:NfeD family protein [Aquabacterium soli]|uniref:NfeD family protein n=1 Tax=Aquabacterium soli TaxID=2493092 RepID=A0A3R8S4R9_9BURK|nr:NfeD family protein [Aquabacterium soli]RRS05459.1 NfeD family protein [Aquabacterium soli]